MGWVLRWGGWMMGDIPDPRGRSTFTHELDLVDHLSTVSDIVAPPWSGFGSYGGHGFDSTRRMLPIDPNDVES